MIRLSTFLMFLLVILNFQANAQSFYEHEVSLNAGIFQLRSDYGVRNDIETNFGNQGTSISLNYYYVQAYRRSKSYFQDHFKPRLSLMYSSTDLKHYGPYADDFRLAAMKGSYVNLSIGGGLDYYPLKIKLVKKNKTDHFLENFSPFLGFGIGINFVKPDAESSLAGGLSNIENIFPTFRSETIEKGIDTKKQTVLSLNLRSGLRYKLNFKSELILESGWMIFNSDFIDGLNPIGPQNRNSDWSWGINLGYSYILF